MSSTITEIEWPEALPLPYIDAEGAPDHALLNSPLQSAIIQRRVRFHANPVTMAVRWVLGMAQHTAFKDFFITDLANGTSLFKIDLRYPKNSELTNWVVRFVGSYEAQYLDKNWEVSAQIDLIRESVLADVSATDTHTGLYVPESEDSEAEFQPYITSDGYHYHVTI